MISKISEIFGVQQARQIHRPISRAPLRACPSGFSSICHLYCICIYYIVATSATSRTLDSVPNIPCGIRYVVHGALTVGMICTRSSPSYLHYSGLDVDLQLLGPTDESLIPVTYRTLSHTVSGTLTGSL